jgi:hypothetical protein
MTVDVDTLVELVLQRLLRPRVGLLWWNETLPSARMPEGEIAWIHYLGTKCLPRESVRPCTVLATLDTPEEEAKTLTLLAIPRCRPVCFRNWSRHPRIARGPPCCGGLSQGISVVADTNHLASWHSWKGAWNAAPQRLRRTGILGMILVGRETQAAFRTNSVEHRQSWFHKRLQQRRRGNKALRRPG